MIPSFFRLNIPPSPHEKIDRIAKKKTIRLTISIKLYQGWLRQ